MGEYQFKSNVFGFKGSVDLIFKCDIKNLKTN